MAEAAGSGPAGIDVPAIEARIERLLAALAQPPPVRARSEELVRVLMSLYGAGLTRVVGLLERADVLRLADDDLVGSLLVLHDLHPRTAAERIELALQRVRPDLGASADGVELIGVDVGVDDRAVARIRLGGAREGCRSTAAEIRRAVEQAVLDAAPELAAVRWEAAPAAPALLQIGSGPPRQRPAPPAEGTRG